MLAILRPAIGAGIELRVDLADSLLHVRVEQDQLDQLLLNLVVNASDALPGGGQIRLSTRLETQRETSGEERCFAAVTVEDDGAGISEAAREHLFEPFFTTKDVGRGTGLGLATVYAIVQQSGGKIRVESQPGEGARFEVLIPSEVGAANPLEVAETGAARSESEQGSETLLLVDDEASVRGLVRKLLERCGYRVLEAEDPRSALALARSEPGPIHLLLTDLVMPGTSGTDLAREVRRQRPGVAVLFMTGHVSSELREALEKDAGQVLGKPFSSAQLLESVRRCLDAPGSSPA
jgi:CheY-like chemotaxis protein